LRFIIITGMGRSGSTFLAELLNHAANAEARHEYLAGKHFLSLSYYHPGHPYLVHELTRNRRDVEAEWAGTDLFIDVNPYLRYGLDTVRSALDTPRIYHLVRDGRKVVSSMYLRKTYTKRENKLPIMPLDTAGFVSWTEGSRFEKLCWYWRDTVDRMLEAELPILKLDNLTGDFGYLRERLLEPEGIALDESAWRQMKDKQVNRNRFHPKYLLRGRPQKLDWTADTEARFREICGEAMGALGYE
jgi:hypothetical protein